MSNIDWNIRRIHLGDGREVVNVECGYIGHDHIVPPAGEEYTFDVARYRRKVEIYRSRTGRSVRIWVDGEEVK